LRAFVVAGRPGLGELESFGRFEEWSNLVRGALVWLGEPDPCETRADIDTDDPDRNAFGQLLHAIHERMGDKATSAGDLYKLTETDGMDDTADDALTNAVDGVAPRNAKQLGHYLKAHKDGIVEGLRLLGQYDTHQKIWTYRVRRT
jgi:hypothetical protein